MQLELVYRATADVVALDPETGRTFVAAVKGEILTPAEVEQLGVKGAPRKLRPIRTTEG